MNIFNTILKEALEDEETTGAFSKAPEETTEVEGGVFSKTSEEETVEDTELEVTEEIPEEPIEEVSEKQQEARDIIMSVLDALEQEALAQGDEITDDESVDVGLELLYKMVPKLADEDLDEVITTLQDYFDIDAGEDVDEEYFEDEEETSDEEYAEDKEVRTESRKKF